MELPGDGEVCPCRRRWPRRSLWTAPLTCPSQEGAAAGLAAASLPTRSCRPPGLRWPGCAPRTRGSWSGATSCAPPSTGRRWQRTPGSPPAQVLAGSSSTSSRRSGCMPSSIQPLQLHPGGRHQQSNCQTIPVGRQHHPCRGTSQVAWYSSSRQLMHPSKMQQPHRAQLGICSKGLPAVCPTQTLRQPGSCACQSGIRRDGLLCTQQIQLR